MHQRKYDYFRKGKIIMRLKEKGFSLIEVMIASLLLSIAALSFVGTMGFTTLRLTQSNYKNIAYDEAQKLKEVLQSYGGDYTVYINSSTGIATGSTTGCSSDTANCTSAARVNYEIYNWINRDWKARTTLPSIGATSAKGNVIVCRDGSPNDGSSAANPACDNTGNVVIKIWWNTATDTSKWTPYSAPRVVLEVPLE